MFGVGSGGWHTGFMYSVPRGYMHGMALIKRYGARNWSPAGQVCSTSAGSAPGSFRQQRVHNAEEGGSTSPAPSASSCYTCGTITAPPDLAFGAQITLLRRLGCGVWLSSRLLQQRQPTACPNEMAQRHHFAEAPRHERRCFCWAAPRHPARNSHATWAIFEQVQ